MGTTLFLSDSQAILSAVASVFGDEFEGRGGESGPRSYLLLQHGLLEMPLPEELNPALGKPWTYAQLPMVPANLRPNVPPGAKAALDRALDAILDPDVAKIIIAARPDAKGCLFFDDLFSMIPDELDVWRLWPSSLHVDDLRRALSQVKPLGAFDPHVKLLLAERELEWAIRQNLSRLCSLAQGDLTPVSLLGTPALFKLGQSLCNEEEKGATVEATFHEGIYFEAKVIDACGRVVGFGDQAEIDGIIAKCLSRPFEEEETDFVELEVPPPRLLTLPALQGLASTRLGLRPKQTYQASLRLYERGLITWPATSGVPLVSVERAKTFSDILMAVHVHELAKVDAIMEAGNLKEMAEGQMRFLTHPVYDPEAIVPTPTPADIAALSEEEREVYLLIVQRFVTALLPDGVDRKTRIALTCGGFKFQGTVTTWIEGGWRRFEGDAPPCNLQLEKGAVITPLEVRSKVERKAVTEFDLLEAMVWSSECKPERRGEVLAWILTHGYAKVDLAGEMSLTEKGSKVLDALQRFAGGLAPLSLLLDLHSAQILIERHGMLFLANQEGRAREYVQSMLAAVRDQVLDAVSLKLPCPECGGRLMVTATGFACENWSGKSKNSCPVNIRGQVMDQDVPPEVMEEMLADGVSTTKMSFVSKRTGKPYKAPVVLDTEAWRISVFFN